MAARIESLFHWSEPRSLAAFERRARAETTLLVVVAAFAALSVVVTVRRMEVLPRSEPATAIGPAARTSSVQENLVRAVEPSHRESAPTEASVALELEPHRDAANMDAALEARSERELYAEFLALESAEELASRAEQTLAAPKSRAESMALLRAVHDTQHPRSAEWFVRAASELDCASNEHGESVPRAAVHWLSQRAGRDESARRTLEAIAISQVVPLDVRSAGARAWIASVPETELRRIEVLFANERDETLFEGVSTALDSRRAALQPDHSEVPEGSAQE